MQKWKRRVWTGWLSSTSLRLRPPTSPSHSLCANFAIEPAEPILLLKRFSVVNVELTSLAYMHSANGLFRCFTCLSPLFALLTFIAFGPQFRSRLRHRTPFVADAGAMLGTYQKQILVSACPPHQAAAAPPVSLLAPVPSAQQGQSAPAPTARDTSDYAQPSGHPPQDKDSEQRDRLRTHPIIGGSSPEC